MQLTHAEYHREQAVELATQRFEWLERDDISADSFDGLEWRWRAHLHAIALLPFAEGEVDKASTPAEACTQLARAAFGAQGASRREAVWAKAAEHLRAGGVFAEGATQFLSLFHFSGDGTLQKLFEEESSVRAPLLNAWRVQSIAVPAEYTEEIFRSPEASRDDQLAALAYVGASPDAGREHFEPFFASPDAEIAEVALCAALIRGFPDAGALIGNAVSRTNDDRLFRLAALSGEPHWEAALTRRAESAAERGLMDLALYGRKEIVPPLLAAIENQRTAEAAALAWRHLTGQRLPRVPRLRLVGQPQEEPENALPEEREQRVPDAAAARAWWEQNKKNWPAGARYLFGRVMDTSRLLHAASAHAGRLGRIYHLLLAASLKKPLAASPDTWVIKRRACYRGLGGGASQGAPSRVAERAHG